MRDFLPFLAGDRTFSNEAPTLAGVSHLPPLSSGIIIGEEGPPILR
jgi:hypothetical protein